MAVRAKFRCSSIRLTPSSAMTPEFAELYEKHGYPEAKRIAEEQGIEQNRQFNQPTVELFAVTPANGATDENKAFFAATPAAKIEMTITNPDAAETFELGKEYYVDFSPAG